MTPNDPRPTPLDRAIPNVPLASYTSLRIGGPAAALIEVKTTDELAQTVQWLRRHHEPFFIIGGGTNLLVDDAGLRCLVVVNRAADSLETLPAGRLRASSGTTLAAVVEHAAASGLTGLEFAAGIPGSFGGGIVGNAGAWGEALGDVLTEVEVITRDGERAVLPACECGFVYRGSRLREMGAILLAATVQLRPGSPAAIRSRIEEILAARAARHPDHTVPTAGSFFRNVEPTSAAQRRAAAGAYLEEVGAKTLRVGDAAVYAKHANIVINAGAATAAQVRQLTEEMRRRVYERFAIWLEPEVRYVAPDTVS